LRKAQAQWPGYYRAFEKAMRVLWDSNRDMVKNSRAENFEEFMEFWYSAGKINKRKKEVDSLWTSHLKF
jgi:homospermidine synthase